MVSSSVIHTKPAPPKDGAGLVSGGSALTPFPAPDITLEHKIATTNLLLACGANIDPINSVRKHLSRIRSAV